MDATLLPPAETEAAHKTDRKSVRRPRIELITRGERRRRWSIEQKQEIVAESLSPGTTPAEVARKHAIGSGLLYTWRQQLLANSRRWHDRHRSLPRSRSPARQGDLTYPIARRRNPLGQQRRRLSHGSKG